jgi:hypothetical protein
LRNEQTATIPTSQPYRMVPSKSPNWSQLHGKRNPRPCSTKAISEATPADDGARPAARRRLIKVCASLWTMKPTRLMVPSVQRVPFGQERTKAGMPPRKRLNRSITRDDANRNGGDSHETANFRIDVSRTQGQCYFESIGRLSIETVQTAPRVSRILTL